MLDRCGRLGMLACACTPDGRILDVRAPNMLWAELMQAPALAGAIARQVATDAGVSGVRRVAAPAALDKGVSLATCAVADDAGDTCWVAVLLLGPQATQSGLLSDAAREAGLDPADVPQIVSSSPSSSGATATLLQSMLRAMAQDTGDVLTARTEAGSFTTQLTDAYETIDLLYAVGRAMKAPQSPTEFLSHLCSRARQTLNFAWLGVAFDTQAPTPASLRGVAVVHGDVPVAQEQFGAALASLPRRNATACEVSEDVLGCAQVIHQALLSKGRVVGTIAAGGKGGADPMVSSYDTRLLDASAGFVGTFIENVQLYDEQNQMFLGTVQALTAAIDAKDRYTRGHSERVAHMSGQIAALAGLPPPQCERIRIAGLVHDVGKIGVPEAVLTKQGRLTDEEFAHIKKHPETGYRILQAVPMLGDVLPGVLHHHERYDGKGYPHGLEGSDIPLMARIISVADTFDAMSSDRSYRKRLAREAVLAEIVRSAGTQLDPRLAHIAAAMDFSEYDAMAQRHADGAGEAAAA
jgi:HD-GYP domain-containing protein (c-di-GMP phosphodiesterase class II)